MESIGDADAATHGAGNGLVSRDETARAAQTKETSETRGRILRIIQEKPGAHLRWLQREAGVGWGQLSYHISVLLRKQWIRLEQDGRRTRAYPAGATPARGQLVEGVARRVLLALKDQVWSTTRELELALGVSRQLVTYHLRRLEAKGLVHSDARGIRRFRRARRP